MTFSGFLTILVCASFTVASNILLRLELKRPGLFDAGVITALLHLMMRPRLLMGVVCFVSSNLLWWRILATQPVAASLPTQIGLVFFFNTLLSMFIFAERLTPMGIAGLALVLAGITLTARSTVSTAVPPADTETVSSSPK